ncbi:hypothetical protein ACI2JA_00330 [Alkalihalobacillus sp. NPDC078783]
MPACSLGTLCSLSQSQRKQLPKIYHEWTNSSMNPNAYARRLNVNVSLFKSVIKEYDRLV